ncbi:FUSC family protein [Desulfotomaculum nigrificans]|uniref:FUSC family protein n=1 Tax=Desulfotomaculum nigrificans TaxID=1565 RepID=UPI0001FADF1E|nr:aromatic acid exporter family protein [Desulfotomaculum nigrificans]
MAILKRLRLKMPFGARMIKTAIAVVLTVYLTEALKLSSAVAAVTAIINVQPSLSRSLKNAGEQLAVHVLGVAVGLIIGYLWAPGPLAMGLATPLVIWLALKFGFSDVVMALVPMVIILSSPRDAFISEALNRSIVIFLGLAVGLMVNALVAPPKYRDRLVESLIRMNNTTADFFCSLASGFNHLSLMPEDEYNQKRKEVKNLLAECRGYFELWQEQKGRDTSPFPWQDELLERYIDFNSNLYHKGKDIYEATKQRIAWREQMGNPPIAPEFEAILAMLEHGNKDFAHLNILLQQSLFEGRPAEFYPVDEEFWREMSAFVDRWHDNLSGAYYLHAFMFLAVVANNLKFANRTAKEFLNIIYVHQDLSHSVVRERFITGQDRL